MLHFKVINVGLVGVVFKHMYCKRNIRPIARIEFGEVRDPPKVDLLDPKSGLFEPHPLNPPTKPQFWPTLWLKVDLLADLGWCIAPPPPHTHPWLRA